MPARTRSRSRSRSTGFAAAAGSLKFWVGRNDLCKVTDMIDSDVPSVPERLAAIGTALEQGRRDAFATIFLNTVFKSCQLATIVRGVLANNAVEAAGLLADRFALTGGPDEALCAEIRATGNRAARVLGAPEPVVLAPEPADESALGRLEAALGGDDVDVLCALLDELDDETLHGAAELVGTFSDGGVILNYIHRMDADPVAVRTALRGMLAKGTHHQAVGAFRAAPAEIWDDWGFCHSVIAAVYKRRITCSAIIRSALIHGAFTTPIKSVGLAIQILHDVAAFNSNLLMYSFVKIMPGQVLSSRATLDRIINSGYLEAASTYYTHPYVLRALRLAATEATMTDFYNRASAAASARRRNPHR